MLEVYWFSVAVGFIVFFIIKKHFGGGATLFKRISSAPVIEKSPEVECESQNCCKTSNNPKQQTNGSCNGGNIDQTHQKNINEKIVIVFGTTTGKSELFSRQLVTKLQLQGCWTEIMNASEFGSNIEDKMKELCLGPGTRTTLVVVISTYTEGAPPESARWFYTWLSDMAGDFRVSHNMLATCRHAVFGLGNSLYSEHYNTVARDVDTFLTQLGSTRRVALGLGDENVDKSVTGSLESDFEAWSREFMENMTADTLATNNGTGEANVDDNIEEDESEDEEEDEVMDIEDLGAAKRKPVAETAAAGAGGPKEMVTPLLRKTLTKQGYKIIGSHSGVKLCRWTKSMLRGRGGCYKHTFYGIDSHR